MVVLYPWWPYIHGGLTAMVALQPWWPFALYLCACRPKGISCFGLESTGEMGTL